MNLPLWSSFCVTNFTCKECSATIKGTVMSFNELEDEMNIVRNKIDILKSELDVLHSHKVKLLREEEIKSTNIRQVGDLIFCYPANVMFRKSKNSFI